MPDTKYYYTFRAIDIHEHVSNPTEVYEVELVSVLDGATAGQIAFIPIVKIINFEKEIKESSLLTKPMKKYIIIGANSEQGDIDEEYLEGLSTANDAEKEPLMGGTSNGISIFDKKKKFKIRLTSKETGRRLDLNIDFKVKHVHTDGNKENII